MLNIRLNKWWLPSLVLFSLYLISPVSADDQKRLDFNIYRTIDTLYTWIDISPFISSQRQNELKQGATFEIRLKAELERPRRVWGAENIRVSNLKLLIKMDNLTKRISLSDADSSGTLNREFTSLGKLHRYLTDSVSLAIIVADSLSKGDYYSLSLELNIANISRLSLFRDDSGSPLGFLFGQFLDLTSYNSETFTVKSRTFRISDTELID